MTSDLSSSRPASQSPAPTDAGSSPDQTVILGAGPAGLSAAYTLARTDQPLVLIEKEAEPGGLCRTFDFHGRFFDIGPHVFIRRSPEIGELLHELGGEQLREITHIEGIYYEGKLYDSWFDAVVDLDLVSKIRAMLGLLARRARPIRDVASCEDGLINSYGSVIYSKLAKVHQCKFWGVDPAEIDVSWARVYEKPTSLFKYAKRRLSRSEARSVSYEPAVTYYPSVGAQVIYGAMVDRITGSAESTVKVDSEVVAVHRDGPTVTRVELRDRASGRVTTVEGREFISTIPVTELVEKLRPAPPAEILEIARSLKYRSLVAVNMLYPLTRELPYGWVEIHTAGVQAGRLTNFAQLSPEMGQGDNQVPICLEYYCFPGDETWQRSDGDMIAQAHADLVAMGFGRADLDGVGFVQREQFAYPMYLRGYRDLLARLKEYCDGITNLQTIGRGGIYRYNNMGHSIESGLRAAENVRAGRRQHDLWGRSVVDGKI